MKALEIRTDGSISRRHKITTFSAVIFLNKKPVKIYTGKKLGGTSNTAEWDGLILGLRVASAVKEKTKELRGLIIYMDSQLVVNQINGVYACHGFPERMARAKQLIYDLKQRSVLTAVHWVPRNENEVADRAAVELRKEWERKLDLETKI